MKALGSILGGVGKDLATGQVCDALIVGCKQICDQPSTTWVATIAGLAAGPQLWLCLLGGSVLLEWRANKKNDAEVQARFTALMDELTEVRAAAGRDDLVNDRLARILDREDFVLARLPGYEKADIAKAVGREVERVLGGLGLPTESVVGYWTNLFGRLGAIEKKLDAVAAVQGEQATKADVERLERLILSQRPEGLTPDASVERDLTRGIERLVRNADSGNPIAERIVERGDSASVVEYLLADRAKLVAVKAALDGKVNEDLIQRDREIAAAAYFSGRIPLALEATSRILDASPSDAGALELRGIVHSMQGNVSEARRVFESLLKTTGDDGVLARAHHNLAGIDLQMGDLGSCERRTRLALDAFTRIKDDHNIISALLGLAKALRLMGRHGEALAALDSARECGGRSADRTLEIHFAGETGLWLIDVKEFDSARQILEQACDLSRSLDYKLGLALCLTSLGLAYEHLDELVLAESAWTEALSINRILGREFAIAINQKNLGRIGMRQDNQRMAMARLEQFLEGFLRIGAMDQVADVTRMMSELGSR